MTLQNTGAVMELREDILYENFKKCQAEALKAKEAGDIALAKNKLREAAGYMDKLALISSGSHRAKRHDMAVRVRSLADDIAPGTAARPVQTAAPQQRTEKPAADNEKITQYLTIVKRSELGAGFEGVIGLEDAKRAITEYIINPMRYPEEYNYNFIDNRAVLLEGPPGTGKTTFALAAAKEMNVPFALINVASLVNCYIGETAKNIDRIFEYIRNYAAANNTPVIAFFDEFDEVAKKRDSNDKTAEAAVPALLRNLDGVKRNKNLFVLANVNDKNWLDPAVAERFRKIIHIPLPDEAARRRLFCAKLCEVEQTFLERIDFAEAARLSEGLSGRDITFICDDFKHLLGGVKAKLVSEGDVNASLQKFISERAESKR